jgi:succinate dehydrogenase/fumarate reductase flavoprotein subunit
LAYSFVKGKNLTEWTTALSATQIDGVQARLTCDVLVAGSGAAGLAAATAASILGLQVILAEKDRWIGGTTALSGGFMWLPGNPVSKRAGVADSADAARTYLAHEAGNHFDSEKIDMFLATIEEAVGFYESRTALAFEAAPDFSDYHPEAPGGVAGGRSIIAKPIEGKELGARLTELRPALPELKFAGMTIGTGPDLKHFSNATRSVRSAAYVAGRFARHIKDIAVHGQDMRLTNGRALAGRLFRSAIDAGVDVRVEAPLIDLLIEEGKVRGAVIANGKGVVEVLARRGVILATGGFPNDKRLRRRLFPHDAIGVGHLSPAPASNTGDSLRLAERAGASLTLDYPNAAAWVPVSRVPRKDGGWGLFPHFIDRGKPGLIAVKPNGRRFANEANSYHDFMQGLFKAQEPGDRYNAFLVVDHRFLRAFGLGFVKPFPVPYAPHVKSGYLKTGRTLEDLAAAAGIDAKGLVETVASFNRDCANGVDRAFGKGSTAYNRFYGDSRYQPNPCLAPIENGPFFAVEIFVGDLGTFAGIRTNAHAQVVRDNGEPIAGLYAVGNDAASIAGGNYPGGGITLGPAIVFGYLAARRLANSPSAIGASSMASF